MCILIIGDEEDGFHLKRVSGFEVVWIWGQGDANERRRLENGGI